MDVLTDLCVKMVFFFKNVEERGKNTKEVQVVSISCLCKHMDNEVNGTSFQPDEIKHRQCFLFVSVICDLLFLSTFITKLPCLRLKCHYLSPFTQGNVFGTLRDYIHFAFL